MFLSPITRKLRIGITVSTATNWIVNGIVGATLLTLLEDFRHHNTLLLYGGIEILSILFFLTLVPETEGISLEKIALNFFTGKKLRDLWR